jgi:plastocyanin
VTLEVLPTTVEVDFDLPVASTTLLTIGHPTLGAVESGGAIGGARPTDISNRVRSVVVQRGRSRSLDEIDPGRCTVSLINDDRTFDPLHGPASFVSAGSGFAMAPVPVAVTGWDLLWVGQIVAAASGQLMSVGVPGSPGSTVASISVGVTPFLTARYGDDGGGTTVVSPSRPFAVGELIAVRFAASATHLKCFDVMTFDPSIPPNQLREVLDWPLVNTPLTAGVLSVLPSNTVAVHANVANSLSSPTATCRWAAVGGYAVDPVMTFTAADGGVSPGGSWVSRVTGETWTIGGSPDLVASCPFYGLLTPGRAVRVRSGDVEVFSGRVEDWDYQYTVGGESPASMTAVDGLADLALRKTGAFVGTAEQTSGQRVASVLNRSSVGYPPASRSIDTGRSVLQADAVSEDQNALEYLQRVARTEAGVLFCDRVNTLVFRDRMNLLQGDDLELTDDPEVSTPRFADVSVASGARSIANEVSITRSGGVTQIYTNDVSVAVYGRRSLSIDGLLFSTDAQAAAMASFLAGSLSSAEPRVASTVIKAHTLSEAHQRAVYALDVGDLVTITWTPNRVGAAMVRTVVVEGVSHDIGPATHFVTLSFGEIFARAAFTIEDPLTGAVGSSPIAF